MSLTWILVGFWLACFGLAYVVGHSKISLPFRIALDSARVRNRGLISWLAGWILALIECPACLGFWFGFIARYVWPVFAGVTVTQQRFLSAITLGLITCTTNFIIGTLTRLIHP